MEHSFFQYLSSDTKEWVARAVIGMVIVDRMVSQGEMAFLREVLGCLEDKALIDDLVSRLKSKQVPDLQPLVIGRDFATEILFYLISIMLSDDKLSCSEVKFFKNICHKLGFSSAYSKQLVEWAQDMLNMNRKKEKLVKLAQVTTPSYQTNLPLAASA